MSILDTPLRRVMGGKTATVLGEQLDLHTLGDLLHHYPRRYEQRGELSPLESLREGEYVTLLARVNRTSTHRVRNSANILTESFVTDGKHELRLTFFRQKFRQRQLLPGRWGLFSGKVSRFRNQLQLVHPDCVVFDGSTDSDELLDTIPGGLIPIYPASAGLPSWRISKAVKLALETAASEALPEPLPQEVRRRHDLPSLIEALQMVHHPADRDEARRGLHRLTWDEAFVLQVELARRRAVAAASPATARPPRPGGLVEAFAGRLPFQLTAGQRAVVDELRGELSRPHPMHRLLQGEVGSGKTVVALLAMLQVVDAGGQAALLAPTEVLAQQHARSLRALLGPLAESGRLGGADVATSVALLTGSLSASARRAALLDAASGNAGIVVGTHALLTENVSFADLGLVVVDEQHRFGVEQRDALRAKGETPPHVLVMTATPIPRTVAMTVYGDLETSTLRELPQGRLPIASHVVPALEKPQFLERAWARIREEVAAGGRAYVVCPRIGDDSQTDEDVDERSADEAAEHPRDPVSETPSSVVELLPSLTHGPLQGLRVGVLHGRLPADEKDDVMRGFADGELDVLVATTVIEVGVDVPDATVMVVMHAERFGVSQLHQLRGRVGRGGRPGLCLLVTDTGPDDPARRRLEAVAGTTDGFELARLDLETRREGNVLGVQQHGRRSGLRLLTLLRDEDLIRQARDEAEALVTADPTLSEHPDLAAALRAMLDEADADYLEKV
jgi:ATP-dependent DNA helicase RecG